MPPPCLREEKDVGHGGGFLRQKGGGVQPPKRRNKMVVKMQASQMFLLFMLGTALVVPKFRPKIGGIKTVENDANVAYDHEV